MIPNNAYMHVRHGNGATPKAWHRAKDGNCYGLSNWSGRVCARFYPLVGESVDIPLSDIPETVESDWDCYWEGEC